ncbi:aromatic ring-hydroxylating dioxygenase subunit alpha [Sporolactobacillus sp. THM7-7]|nr:aromatic ring-hydroxylating dioxygenase subunit alpha [Sporolactobacillus sp. THM7-7]
MLNDQALLSDWIVACPASDVNEKPIQVNIMDERVVLFRTSTGEVYAFKDLCIHRGAALSLGKIKDDKIVCPYHAWEYNTEGKCVRIPQLPCGRGIPTKAKLVPYASKEAYGFIWLNLNNNAPAFFKYSEFDDPDYRNVIWGPQSVNAKAPRVIENFLDVSHLAVVHEGYLGDASHMEIQDHKVMWDTDSIRSEEIPVYQPNPDGVGLAKTVYYTYEILRPLTVTFSKRDPENGRIFSMLFSVLPVSGEKSIAYGVMSFNYETNQSDEEMNRFQDLIFSQDKPVVESQKPEDLPLDLREELHLKIDQISMTYRKYLDRKEVKLGTE